MQLIEQFENLRPFRLEPGKVPLAVSLRNACFDAVFYDTFNLTNEEKGELLAKAFDYDEGGMLFVYPGEASKRIEYYSLSHDLLEAHPELDTISIPGVGSSVVGTAALARQVADITKRPAVGIIAGYGAADLISEALGGWFDFGMRNRIRSAIAEWKRWLAVGSEEVRQLQRAKYKIKSTTYLVDEPESNTLLNIMLRHAKQLTLICGHSKGALNIYNVLPKFLDETDLEPEAYRDIAIVTFGCGVAIPEEFRNIHQYLGTWDVLGAINTPPNEYSDPSLTAVQRKGHNLCSWNPIHMPVHELLERDLTDRGGDS